MIYHSSKAASTDHNKACTFNEYSHSVFTNSSFELPSSHLFHTPTAFIDHIEFSDVDVYTELIQLDSTKAIAIDGIGPKVLKHCAFFLYHPIHHLFCTSLAIQERSSLFFQSHFSVECLVLYNSQNSSGDGLE